jgi:hypothetical protein
MVGFCEHGNEPLVSLKVVISWPVERMLVS